MLVVWFDLFGLLWLDFLKFDIEGMEIDVLCGVWQLIEVYLLWCWIEYWKVGEVLIIDMFVGFDYMFYWIDGLNLLCVLNLCWDWQCLFIMGELFDVGVMVEYGVVLVMVVVVDVDVFEMDWNCVFEYELCGEWGYVIDCWWCVCGCGFDDEVIVLQFVLCYGFVGMFEVGFVVFDLFGDLVVLFDVVCGCIQLVCLVLLLCVG